MQRARELEHVQVQINPLHLEYTQENIGRWFQDGRPLEELITDLRSGEVNPLEHPEEHAPRPPARQYLAPHLASCLSFRLI